LNGAMERYEEGVLRTLDLQLSLLHGEEGDLEARQLQKVKVRRSNEVRDHTTDDDDDRSPEEVQTPALLTPAYLQQRHPSAALLFTSTPLGPARSSDSNNNRKMTSRRLFAADAAPAGRCMCCPGGPPRAPLLSRMNASSVVCGSGGSRQDDDDESAAVVRYYNPAAVAALDDEDSLVWEDGYSDMGSPDQCDDDCAGCVSVVREQPQSVINSSEMAAAPLGAMLMQTNDDAVNVEGLAVLNTKIVLPPRLRHSERVFGDVYWRSTATHLESLTSSSSSSSVSHVVFSNAVRDRDTGHLKRTLKLCTLSEFFWCLNMRSGGDEDDLGISGCLQQQQRGEMPFEQLKKVGRFALHVKFSCSGPQQESEGGGMAFGECGEMKHEFGCNVLGEWKSWSALMRQLVKYTQKFYNTKSCHVASDITLTMMF